MAQFLPMCTSVVVCVREGQYLSCFVCMPQAPHLSFTPDRQAISLVLSRRQRPISINFDANAKLGHYKNCGQATTAAFAQLTPLYSSYFGRGGGVAQDLIERLSGSRVEPTGEPAAGVIRTYLQLITVRLGLWEAVQELALDVMPTLLVW